MLTEYLSYGSFVGAIALILSSAWLASRSAYYAIVVLLAAGFFLAEVSTIQSTLAPRVMTIVVDVLIFGALFYFVTVQHLMNRRFYEVTSRGAFREALQHRGAFSAFSKFVYYLPVALVIGAIAVAGVGSYLSS